MELVLCRSLVEEVKTHGPVKDEPMDVNMPAPKLPALSPQPATIGSVTVAP